MPSSGMLRSVALVRSDVSEANVVPSSPILVTLMIEALRSSETSVLTRATRRNIAEDGIFPLPCFLFSSVFVHFGLILNI
jgi:hypothetical protein